MNRQSVLWYPLFDESAYRSMGSVTRIQSMNFIQVNRIQKVRTIALSPFTVSVGVLVSIWLIIQPGTEPPGSTCCFQR